MIKVSIFLSGMRIIRITPDQQLYPQSGIAQNNALWLPLSVSSILCETSNLFEVKKLALTRWGFNCTNAWKD